MKLINTLIKSRINKRKTKRIATITKSFAKRTSALEELAIKIGALEERLDNVLIKPKDYGKLKRD